MPNVVVWSKPQCPQCVRAKQLLDINNLAYEEKLIDAGKYTREDLLKEVPDARSVPQIIINGKAVGGYQELKEALLDYTKTTKLV